MTTSLLSPPGPLSSNRGRLHQADVIPSAFPLPQSPQAIVSGEMCGVVSPTAGWNPVGSAPHLNKTAEFWSTGRGSCRRPGLGVGLQLLTLGDRGGLKGLDGRAMPAGAGGQGRRARPCRTRQLTATSIPEPPKTSTHFITHMSSSITGNCAYWRLCLPLVAWKTNMWWTFTSHRTS